MMLLWDRYRVSPFVRVRMKSTAAPPAEAPAAGSEAPVAPGDNCGTGHGGFKPGNKCGGKKKSKYAFTEKSALKKTKLVDTSSWKEGHQSAEGYSKKIAVLDQMADADDWEELAGFLPPNPGNSYQKAVGVAWKKAVEQVGKKLGKTDEEIKAALAGEGAKPAIVTSANVKPVLTMEDKVPQKNPLATKSFSAYDVDEWEKKGDKLGTAPGGVYEDASGKKFYVKHHDNKEQAAGEVLSARLYELAGAPILDYHAVTNAAGKIVGTATPWQEAQKADWKNPDELKNASAFFAIHAWLNNRDAIGAGSENPMDNQRWVNGHLTTMDAGGALMFSGLGSTKEFEADASEWDTLRDPKKNQSTAKVFGHMTGEQLYESAQLLKKIQPGDIEGLVNEFAPNGLAGQSKESIVAALQARRESILAKAEKFNPNKKEEPKQEAPSDPKAAAYNDVQQALLGAGITDAATLKNALKFVAKNDELKSGMTSGELLEALGDELLDSDPELGEKYIKAGKQLISKAMDRNAKEAGAVSADSGLWEEEPESKPPVQMAGGDPDSMKSGAIQALLDGGSDPDMAKVIVENAIDSGDPKKFLFDLAVAENQDSDSGYGLGEVYMAASKAFAPIEPVAKRGSVEPAFPVATKKDFAPSELKGMVQDASGDAGANEKDIETATYFAKKALSTAQFDNPIESIQDTIEQLGEGENNAAIVAMLTDVVGKMKAKVGGGAKSVASAVETPTQPALSKKEKIAVLDVAGFDPEDDGDLYDHVLNHADPAAAIDEMMKVVKSPEIKEKLVAAKASFQPKAPSADESYKNVLSAGGFSPESIGVHLSAANDSGDPAGYFTKKADEVSAQMKKDPSLASSPELQKYVDTFKEAAKAAGGAGKPAPIPDELKVIDDVKNSGFNYSFAAEAVTNAYKAADPKKFIDEKIASYIGYEEGTVGHSTKQLYETIKGKMFPSESSGAQPKVYQPKSLTGLPEPSKSDVEAAMLSAGFKKNEFMDEQFDAWAQTGDPVAAMKNFGEGLTAGVSKKMKKAAEQLAGAIKLKQESHIASVVKQFDEQAGEGFATMLATQALESGDPATFFAGKVANAPTPKAKQQWQAMADAVSPGGSKPQSVPKMATPDEITTALSNAGFDPDQDATDELAAELAQSDDPIGTLSKHIESIGDGDVKAMYEQASHLLSSMQAAKQPKAQAASTPPSMPMPPAVTWGSSPVAVQAKNKLAALYNAAAHGGLDALEKVKLSFHKNSYGKAIYAYKDQLVKALNSGALPTVASVHVLKNSEVVVDKMGSDYGLPTVEEYKPVVQSASVKAAAAKIGEIMEQAGFKKGGYFVSEVTGAADPQAKFQQLMSSVGATHKNLFAKANEKVSGVKAKAEEAKKIKPLTADTLPSKPEFQTSNLANKASNEAAIEALQKIATGQASLGQSDVIAALQAVAPHPSPKVNAYKQTLISAVEAAHAGVPLTSSDEENEKYKDPKRLKWGGDVLKEIAANKSYNPALLKETHLPSTVSVNKHTGAKIAKYLVLGSPKYDPGLPAIKTASQDQLNDKTEEAFNKVPNAARESIKAYTNSAYDHINSNFRDGSATPAQKAVATHFTKAAIPIPPGTYLSRGLTLEDPHLMMSAQGKVISEPGYSSTSLNGEGSFSGNVQWRIATGEGTRGMSVHGMSSHGHENEVLLAPNQRFFIHKVIKKDDMYMVFATALPTPENQCCGA